MGTVAGGFYVHSVDEKGSHGIASDISECLSRNKGTQGFGLGGILGS